ncbi:hypothetical protein [Teichococcus aestuarii]|nr:hypothetical protein [Pseudoroseomonas aestuarii]
MRQFSAFVGEEQRLLHIGIPDEDAVQGREEALSRPPPAALRAEHDLT